ncbi:MAG: ATP-binding protein, partial [Desulfobacteraceae bacterium]
NKFYNTLKSNGIACTKNNLYDYLSFLTDAFLFYQSPIHARSERAKQVNPRKIYTIDNSLIQAMTTPDTKDQGARLENLVYMHLRRRGIHPEYYITEQGAEIDFVYFDSSGDEKLRLIQVCWDLSAPKTRQRELQSLRKAMDELNLKSGTIISWMDEESPQDGIEIIPAWKWLLKEII